MNSTVYLDRHGTKVGCADGRLTLKSPDASAQTLPIHQIGQLIVLGHAHFSHDAIALLLRENIPVIFSSLRGGFRGSLTARAGRQIERRLRQCDAVRDPAACLCMARALVLAKLRGHARLLRQWKLAARYEIAGGIVASHRCHDINALRGYEGAGARAFFSGLREHLAGSPFQFEQRRQHPAPDPVNALLSLNYTLLSNEVEVGVAVAGLDCAGGFLHGRQDGRPTLLMDLMEPLRPLADRLSARLLRTELSLGDFEITDAYCHLRDGRRGIVYKAWEALLCSTIGWRGEHITWRALIHAQARECAHWLDGVVETPRFWHLDDS